MSQAVPGFGGYYEELDWLGNTYLVCGHQLAGTLLERVVFLHRNSKMRRLGPYEEIWWYGEW